MTRRSRGFRSLRQEAVDQFQLAAFLLQWVVLGAASGVLAGIAAYVFLEALDRATDLRLDHGWLLWLLPVAGLVIGAVYHYLGGRTKEGTGLLIDEIHEPTAWVPRRMAPMVFAGTVAGHVFGASVGREGAAVQISGSLTDVLARGLRLPPADRRLLLIAAIAGGFSALFGTPLAGAVFALEVQAVGRVRYEALVPALSAAIVGEIVATQLGAEHTARLLLDIPLDGGVLARVAVAGVAFGLVGAAFAELVHLLKRAAARWIAWPPARLVVGALVTLALVGVVGRDYLGLSLPLGDAAVAGLPVSGWDFALKLLFTAVALGSGFPGGEVTPLFVIGATLGSALAMPLGLPPAMLAAIGFVAVFGGAANTPLACTIMGVELFGSGTVTAMAVGCVVAYVFTSHRSIYGTQRIDTPKGRWRIEGQPRVGDWVHRRRTDDA